MPTAPQASLVRPWIDTGACPMHAKRAPECSITNVVLVWLSCRDGASEGMAEAQESIASPAMALAAAGAALCWARSTAAGCAGLAPPSQGTP